jgi:hypothetical protein
MMFLGLLPGNASGGDDCRARWEKAARVVLDANPGEVVHGALHSVPEPLGG